MDNLTSTKPYLTRALYEWMEDNGLTAEILVDVYVTGVEVPQQYVTNGHILLNIRSGAVKDLFITNEQLSFSARFGGVPMDILVPMEALLAIKARENGIGMSFANDEPPPPGDKKPVKTNDKDAKAGDEKSRPSLKIVK